MNNKNLLNLAHYDKNLLKTLSDEATKIARQKYNATRAISHLENFHQKIIEH